MRTAVIINAYSARNAGDAAIMLATASLMASKGYHGLRILSRYAGADRPFYARHGIAVSAPVLHFPVRGEQPGPLRAAIFAGSLLAVLILCAVHLLSHRLSLRIARLAKCHGFLAVAAADAVVIAGGGYVYSSKSRFNLTLYHHLLSIKISSWVSKRVIMMPQSIGPLARRSDEWLVRWAYRNVDPVVARDEPSVRTVSRLMPRKAVVLCPDIAFHDWNTAGLPANGRRLCPPRTNLRTAAYAAGEPKVVCFVLMDWSWARPDGRDQLERFQVQMAEVIRGCVDRGYTVVCAGHSHLSEHAQDDLEFARQVVARSGVSVPVLAAANAPDALRDVYRTADVVVGTRMHSCILAMLELAPALALAYQPKTTGLYAQLGLSDWCSDVSTFEAERLLHDLDQLLENHEAARHRVRDAVSRARLALVDTYSQAGRP
jgi:polysaccharide pyruvyl transferase WcaK-like protein